MRFLGLCEVGGRSSHGWIPPSDKICAPYFNRGDDPAVAGPLLQLSPNL